MIERIGSKSQTKNENKNQTKRKQQPQHNYRNQMWKEKHIKCQKICRKRNKMVSFLCLMAYQPKWII